MPTTTSRAYLEIIATDRATRVLRPLTGIFGSFGRQLLALASAGVMLHLAKQTMEYIHTTGELAERIGESTERLTALEYAAKFADVGIEDLASKIERLQRNLGDAARGSGEAAKALKYMGLSTQELLQLSPYEQFLKISEGLQRVWTQAEKASVVTDLFGRGSEKLLTLLAQGPAVINAYAREAEKLGLTFSKFDAEQVERANDALIRVHAIFQGMMRQVIIQMAPYIEALADKFVDLSMTGGGMGERVTSAFEFMTKGAIEFASQIQRIPAYFYGMAAGIWESDAALRHMMDTATNLDKAFKYFGLTNRTFAEEEKRSLEIAQGYRRKQVEGLEQAAISLNVVDKFFADIRQRQAESALEQARMGQARIAAGPYVPSIISKEETDAIAKVARESDRAKTSLDQMTHEVQRQQAALLGLSGMFDRLEKVQKFGAQAAIVYGEGTDAARIATQEYADSLGDLARFQALVNSEEYRAAEDRKRRIDDLRKEATEIKRFEEILGEAAVTFKRGFGEAFADVIMRISTVKDAFRSLALVVMRSVLVNVGSNIAAGMMGGVAHAGGIIGETSFPMRMLPVWAFETAPRLHAGLAADEFPAILQRGEMVTPRGAGQNVTVNINNQSGTPLSAEGKSRVDGRQMIIDIVVDDYYRHGRTYGLR